MGREQEKNARGAGRGAALVLALCGTLLGGVLAAGPGQAQTATPTLTGARGASLNTYGLPGLIDMPSAGRLEDGALVFTSALASNTLRNTLAFQISPRLTGTFRYTAIYDWFPGGGETYDRSFDVHYLLAEEGGWTPALAVGLRDIVGTGIYSGEYLVGSKSFSLRREDDLVVTAGIGWGRLGSYNSFGNPLGIFSDYFDTRPDGFLASGGVFGYNQWFRGPAALFAGASWQVTDSLSVKAEYSSDAYTLETTRGAFSPEIPVNFGLDWRFGRHGQVSLYALHGANFGGQLTFGLNPRRAYYPGGREAAPVPVAVRPGRAGGAGRFEPSALGIWAGTDAAGAPRVQAGLRARLATALEAEGMVLEALALGQRSVEVRFRNPRFPNEAQALGRVARILTNLMPPEIDHFALVPVEGAMPMARVILNRADLEALEHDPDGAWRSYARARVRAGGALPESGEITPGLYPAYNWSVGPYNAINTFDPDNPFRLDLGAELKASAEILPGLSVSGTLRQKVIGNLDTIRRGPGSRLPNVRSDFARYLRNEGPVLIDLTADWFFKPGPDLHARVSAGYLEWMFAGVAAEVLWRPVGSNLALGAEVAQVQKRAPELGFGLEDYKVTTGHVSAYYDLGNYHLQLDAGRYLAGDYGATFTLERRFNNGWAVGAFATLTDVPFDDFGEGSFDKGLTFTVPLSYFTGQPSKQTFSSTLRPLTRDGGARLLAKNRLYPIVQNYNDPALKADWGRFWR